MVHPSAAGAVAREGGAAALPALRAVYQAGTAYPYYHGWMPPLEAFIPYRRQWQKGPLKEK